MLTIISVLTYFNAILINKVKRLTAKRVICVLFVFVLVLGLSYSKYSSYFQDFFPNTRSEVYSLLSVIGLSYYSFSALSYIIDVYKGKDEVDYDFFDVLLWMTLFTKIVAGPIERHKHFKESVRGKESSFNYDIIKYGLLMCAGGYFYKIVIADRLSIFVDTVYSELDQNYGIVLLLTMILYSLQIYFDFAGYSLIAKGTAMSFGIEITNNFNHPYFSQGIVDFWKRWHISLSLWLRDYVYIPLGGNKKGKFRQYINILLTFIVSGLWHGTGINYVIWGVLHGLYQIFEKGLNLDKRIQSKAIKVVFTFLAVSFAWIFFRAPSLKQAAIFIVHMMQWNPWVLSGNTLVSYGLDYNNWIVVIASVFVSIVVEYYQYKGKSVHRLLQKQNIVVRWLIYYSLIVLLLIFGKYSQNFDSNSFIYFKY